MEFQFDLTKHKDTTENINYNYYSTTFYRNQYEKTVENGGYVKLSYPSHSNKINIMSSVFPDHYLTTTLYILKKGNSAHNVDYDGELVIEHKSSTNSNARLYTCFLLKTSASPTIGDTKIDDLLSATQDMISINLNEIIQTEKIKEAILYDTQQAKVIVFTKPILVKSAFDSVSPLELFPSYSSNYSVVSVSQLLGINIANITEGFKEGVDGTDVVAAAYCQPIDETDPSIGENADVIIPLNSKLSINDATNNTLKTILNFFAFFILILAAVVVTPMMYNMFIVELVLDNKELLLPQQKLNRVCSIDIYISVIFFGFAFSFINYGIANNIPVFTSVGFYVLIFYISALLYFQFNRTMNQESTMKFLQKFLLGDRSQKMPSFDEVKNDISGLVVDNLKILLMNYKTGTKDIMDKKGNVKKIDYPILDDNDIPVKEFAFSNLIVLGMVYWLLYYIATYAGMNKNVSSSFLLSFPFYLFLFAVYIAIFVKYQRQRVFLDKLKTDS